MDVNTLVDWINYEFGEPFLPAKAVQADTLAGNLVLRIGHRIVYFNDEGVATEADELADKWRFVEP